MNLLAKYPRIWCSQCEQLNPLSIMEMPADELNAHAAADLMCGECHLVICTVHEGPYATQDSDSA